MWRGLAKVAEKYVHKGDKICIDGRVRYRTYDDKRGVRQRVTEIWTENMELLSPKNSANENKQDIIQDKDSQENNNDLPF